MRNDENFLSWNANEADTQPKSWFGRSPLLLEANAGTGKTYSLVRIVKRLIQQGIDLEKIVILTFTKKAAREMRERLHELLNHELLTKEAKGPDRDRFILALQQLSYSQIATIHSFCNWIIRQFPEVFGISHDIKLLSSIELITNLVTNYLRQTELKSIPDQTTQVELAELKNQLIHVVNDNQPLLSEGFEYLSYQDHEKKHLYDFYRTTVVDFDSTFADKMSGQNLSYQAMIRLVYDRVVIKGSVNQHSNDLVLRLRSRFKACVVDEFQDTDFYQWEIIKAIFPLKETPVVVIGDPKQSIYAFRGADIRVYQKAKEEIKAAGGVWARLTTNFRTVRNLLEKTNWLSAALFHSTGKKWGELTYQRNKHEWSDPCNEQDLKIRWAKGSPFGVPTLQWIEFRESYNRIALFRQEFIREMALTIPSLIGLEVEVKKEGSWKTRHLTYSDIAVLADQNITLQKINQELTQSGIPSIVVGKGDIWQSEAAYELHRLFRFLERPTDFARRRAFLSGVWAQASLQDIDREQSELNILLERHLRQGLEFYAQHQFSALIGWVSLWSPHWLEKLLTQSRGERLLTDLYHLLDLAIEAASQQVFQSKTPLEWVEDNFSIPTRSEEIEDLRLDKSSDAVRLLTLHNSKGLEFPVVFLMCGLAVEKIVYSQNGVAIYRGESDGLDKGLWWFAENAEDFEKKELVNSRSYKGKDLKKKITQDKELEEKRLWYVGITRAQLALFLPGKIKYLSKRKAKIEQFYKWVDDFKDSLSKADRDEFEQVINPKPLGQNNKQNLSKPQLLKPSYKTGVLKLAYDEPLPFITSYSTEHRQRQRQPPQRETELLEPREIDEVESSRSDTDHFAGSWFGNLFHKAMELWNWNNNPDPRILLTNPNFASILQENLPDELDYRDQLLNELERLMTTTLKVTLKGLNRPLEQFGPQQLKKEISFLNHESDTHRYVKGVIDVLILTDHQFFIIDYKTNLLNAYDPAALEQAMQDNDYILQAKFYAQAVKKYLHNLAGKNYHFGGCLYLFVRGLDNSSEGRGQYFISGNET